MKSFIARGHLAGAVNLPFTDFTTESLHDVLGADANRPIYIYCNNNFRDHRAPIALKSAPLVICPLLSGPSTIIVWTTKEEWNGSEAQARGDHRQIA